MLVGELEPFELDYANVVIHRHDLHARQIIDDMLNCATMPTAMRVEAVQFLSLRKK